MSPSRLASTLALSVLAACTGSPTDEGPLTPEETVQSAATGDTVRVRGTVHTLTYDQAYQGGEAEDWGDAWQRIPGRYLLIRSVVPDGIERTDLGTDDLLRDDLIKRAWTLGIPVDADFEAPAIDQVLEIEGSYTADASWNGHPVPIVQGTPELVEGTPPGASGATCAVDAECGDALYCQRDGTCAALPDTSWGDDTFRDVDGSCASDADCPMGQLCDTTFVVPSSGEYTWRYHRTAKAGRSLCVPDPALDPSEVCGALATPRDLVGGRYGEGKEMCFDATVQVKTVAQDGDSHIQLVVDEPLPYPMMDAHVWLAGAVSEIGPPYKNPARPQGALLDPDIGAHIVLLGTMRWDGGHGWYEVHPLKAWWPAEDYR